MARCRYRSEIYDTYNFQALKMFEEFLYAFYFTPGLEIFIAKESFYKKICPQLFYSDDRPAAALLYISKIVAAGTKLHRQHITTANTSSNRRQYISVGYTRPLCVCV